jgi:hypothetical protein
MDTKRTVSAVVIACAIGSPAIASAQQKPKPPEPPTMRPLLLMGVKASRPLHGMGTLGTLIPLRPLERTGELNSHDDFVFRGLLVEAGGSEDGYELAVGWGRRVKDRMHPAVFGQDLRATAFRTRKPPKDALTNVTYVGGEVGFTALTARLSVGAATRVSGDEAADPLIFTWGIGVHLGR